MTVSVSNHPIAVDSSDDEDDDDARRHVVHMAICAEHDNANTPVNACRTPTGLTPALVTAQKAQLSSEHAAAEPCAVHLRHGGVRCACSCARSHRHYNTDLLGAHCYHSHARRLLRQICC